MDINPLILEMIKHNNNIITTAQAIELGFTRSLLSKYVKAGLLERCRQGVYILSDSVHDDMYTLMLCSEKIVFSHDTALFLNGLSERTPFTHSVTIPSNAKLSKQRYQTLFSDLAGHCKKKRSCIMLNHRYQVDRGWFMLLQGRFCLANKEYNKEKVVNRIHTFCYREVSITFNSVYIQSMFEKTYIST